MSKYDPAINSSLDFIFRPPKKLTFNKLYRMYFDEILRLMYRILIIKNVPETIDETFLKMILFTQGKIVFFNGQELGEGEVKLLALNCSRANMPTVYYLPTQFLVANPRLLKSYTLTPGEDCEVVYLTETDKYNLSEMNGGLFELISRTATIMADNDLSLNIAQKNTRLTNIAAAQTQNAFESLQAVINAMYSGDPNIVVKGSLIDQLQNIPIMQSQSNQNILQLIEVNQYVLAHFLEKIGICTHDQMKRERLVTGEINDNFDLARFNIDDMIMSLNAGFSLVNSHFGTILECELNPIILHQDQTAAALPADDQPEEPDQEEPDQEEPDQEEPDQEEPDQEEPDQEEPDQEEPDQEEPDQEEPDQEEPDQEEPDQEEQNNNTIEINGDNNVIILGGEENGIAERSTTSGEAPDVGGDPENDAN